MREFHLTNFEFGQITSAFSIVYAVMAPLAGLFIDRLGLNAGIMISMTVWSLAGCATGFTQSFRALLACRTVLGIGEAAGIPSAPRKPTGRISNRASWRSARRATRWASRSAWCRHRS